MLAKVTGTLKTKNHLTLGSIEGFSTITQQLGPLQSPLFMPCLTQPSVSPSLPLRLDKFSTTISKLEECVIDIFMDNNEFPQNNVLVFN